ncbi:MAG: ATP-binding protein [Clostridiaceae bacterium]|nr:ATP-binding protein [Clostridiaceae bacterium]
MSKLTDIKYRIDQLEGGAFQNLCDEYLACRGYGTGYSLGMKTGTDKTAKGNPDTYFLSANGKFVFVMYTTQKDNFVSKALDDLGKCFDPDKTGVSPEDVSEIVYCHTFGRLLPGDYQQLHKFCEERNAILTLIGLDKLGNDLYLKYPRIARECLSVSIDTGQITSMREFVQVHDANQMSAPLDTEFLLREEELRVAKEKLCLSSVLIISGPAGVGKTRLALELCEEIASENGYEIVCIKSNKLALYDDLRASFETDKNYLIFVDDANELTGLHFVLDYLPKTVGQRRVQKVVMTVRDYARQQVVNQVLEVEKPEILKVGLLKDEDIRKLIKAAFGITNYLFADRIVTIAEGNARLAMLAGKVAAETGKIDPIRDASDFYDHYYGKQIEIITSSETGVASAGIMAFFQALHLDYLERLQPIFASAKITDDVFISDLKQLHDLELVDLCHDKAAKVSDQSFSNYLIKYAFIDKKIIPLCQMLESCFFINKGKTITACNILLNVFPSKHVQEYIKQQINIVWDHLRPDIDSFLPFFKAFYMVRPTEALVLLKELIDEESVHSFDVRSIAFKKTDSEKTISDDIIEILCGFELNLQLPEAIELLLLYYQKRPDLFEQVYSAFVSRFGVDKDSPRFDYYTQKTVVEQLCAAVESNPRDKVLILFVRVAEQYLKLSFSRTEGGRQRTFTFYTMPLTLHESVLEYRRVLLEQLYKIYESGKCHEEIESLLMDYCKGYGEKIDYEIVRQDLKAVLCFFRLLSPENLYHCVIAEHVRNVAQRAEYDCGDTLLPFLRSHKYEIYHVLNGNRREMLHLGLQEYEEWHREQVQELVQQYDLLKYQHLFQVCNECLEMVDRETQLLSFGVEYAIEASSANQTLYIDVVKAYMGANTPYNIRAYGILTNLFSMMTATEIKSLIDSCEFSQKNTWLWRFFVEIPENQISVDWMKELTLYLENIPKHIRSSPYRPIDEIEKYECVDKDIVLKASRIITAHYEESPFIFSLYFSFMLNTYQAQAIKIITKYENDIPLLEDIYMKCVVYSRNDDYEGQFLIEIIKKDHDFLYCYLDKIIYIDSRFYDSNDEWANRLECIWKEDSFMLYMEQISDYIFTRAEGKRWIYSSIIGHLLLHKEGEADIAEKQERWIQSTIEKHCLDQQRMYGLFNAIDEHGADRRRRALGKLLKLNSDFALFEQLPLEASSWGGSGSMVPYMQERITYLSSLLPMLSGVKYLKHKQRIKRDIETWKSRIKHEEIDELLEAMG